MTVYTYTMAVLLGLVLGVGMGLAMVVTLVPERDERQVARRVIVLPAAPPRRGSTDKDSAVPASTSRKPVGAVAAMTLAGPIPTPPPEPVVARPSRKPAVPDQFARRRATAHPSLRTRLATGAPTTKRHARPAKTLAAAGGVFEAVSFSFPDQTVSEPAKAPEGDAPRAGDIPSILAVALGPPTIEPQEGPRDPEASRDWITVAAVGDIMLGADVRHGDGGPLPTVPPLHKDLAKILRGADLAIGNLEGVIADHGAGLTARPCGTNCYRFRMPGQAAARLSDAGFDLLGLANNHGLDFGPEGQLHTMAHLKLRKLGYAGLKRANADVALRQVRDLVVGYIAFGTHRCCLDLRGREEAGRRIQALAKVSDIQVVSFHGGSEGAAHQHLPKRREYFLGMDRGDVHAFARMAVNAGADLVVGSGPHVPRAFEVYKGRLIAYSLGNFWTLRDMSIAGPSGLAPILVAKLGRSGRLRDYTVHSARQRGAGPRPDARDEAWKKIMALTRDDFPETPATLGFASNLPDPEQREHGEEPALVEETAAAPDQPAELAYSMDRP